MRPVVVCKVFLSVVCKCSHSSCGVPRELDKVVSSKVFLCGQFGFTRPIQYYGSGPGTWDGGWVGLKFYTSWTSWLNAIVTEQSFAFQAVWYLW
jgi:hypothetical protein